MSAVKTENKSLNEALSAYKSSLATSSDEESASKEELSGLLAASRADLDQFKAAVSSLEKTMEVSIVSPAQAGADVVSLSIEPVP